MQQTILAGTRIQLKYFVQATDGYAVYNGYGYFQSVDETGAVGNAATYNYTIVADGDMNIESTIPQNSEEGQLLSVLMDENNDLVTDSNNDLIIA
jgi:hypothetical protein